MIFVLRGGVLVPKGADRDARTTSGRSDFPTPHVSRIEPFESPVTGKEITSWRQRDADMKASDSVDPRDFPKGLKKRGRATPPKEQQGHG